MALVHQRVHSVPSEQWDRRVRHISEGKLVVLLCFLFVLAEHMFVFNVYLVWKQRSSGGYDGYVDGFRNLSNMIQFLRGEGVYKTYFPRLDEYTHSRPEKDHPTRVIVVVNEVKKHHNLNKHVRHDRAY